MFEEVFERTTGNGWLTKNEAHCLFNLVGDSVPGTQVEVGSHYGRSTIIIGHAALISKSEIVSIDPYEDAFLGEIGSGEKRYKTFLSNIKEAGLEKVVRLVRKRVEDVSILGDVKSGDAEVQIGTVFLDGDHTEEGTRRQILFALRCDPRVIALHDYHSRTPDGITIVETAISILGRPQKVIDTLAVWTE